MNLKQFTLMVVACAVIGGLGLYLYNRRSADWDPGSYRVGEKVFPKFPLSEVNSIQIKSRDGEVNLVRTNDAWRVQERAGYPANFREVNNLAQRVEDLKIGQVDPVSSNTMARLELISPEQGGGGTLLIFKESSGKTLETVLLGKLYMRKSDDSSPFGGGGFPAGRWILLPGATPSAALVTESFENAVTNPERWLDRDFLRVEKIRSVALTGADGNPAWKLARESESGEWKLENPQPSETLDVSKATAGPNALAFPSFEDVKPSTADPKETGLESPMTVTVETFDHLVYGIRVGRKDDTGRYHVQWTVTSQFPKTRAAGEQEQPEEKERLDKEFADRKKQAEEKVAKEKAHEGWVYLMGAHVIDPLVRPRSELIKTEEPAAPVAEQPGPAAAEPVPPPPADPNGPPAPPSPETTQKPAEPKPEEAPKPAEEKPAEKAPQ